MKSTFLPESGPTTKNLRLARRSAARMRAISACPPCKSIKQKCDNLRPCSRCKRIGREARCLSSQSDDNLNFEVERPVTCTTHILELSGNESPFPSGLVLKYQWSDSTVMRYWKSGYRCHELVKLFNSLPNPLPSMMDTIFSSLVPSSEAQKSESPLPVVNLQHPDPNLCEPSFWDSEREYGCIEISFDSVTGERKRIFMNGRFANIYGFHREELVARFANHDADLQVHTRSTASDCAALFAFRASIDTAALYSS